MKQISVILLFILGFTGLLMAQPTFPSVTKVFAETKADQRIYQKLKTDYDIDNPTTSTWEMKYMDGSNQMVTSEFHTYKSKEWLEYIGNYIEDDRATVVFTLTTPKSKEGVVYKLPIAVEYTRLSNMHLTDTWSYFYYEIGEPYEAVGGKEDAQFTQLFLEELKAIPISAEGNYHQKSFPDDLGSFISITSINRTSKAIQRNYTSSSEDRVKVEFLVKGTTITYADDQQTQAIKTTENCELTVVVGLVRSKENGTKGNWSVEEFFPGLGELKEGNATESSTLYATLLNIGFDAIYQKQPQVKALPYFTTAYEERFENDLEKALTAYLKGSSNELSQFFDPTALTALNNFVADMKAKCVTIGFEVSEDRPLIDVDLNDNQDPESASVRLNITIGRADCNVVKENKAIYKAAGMSKDVLATGGGFSTTDSYDLTVQLKNGNYLITSGPVVPASIPF